MKLTAKTVENLPVVKTAKIFWDSELKGFGVRVRPPTNDAPQGLRTYVVNYRPEGGGRTARQRRMSLGSTSVIEVGEARKAAKRALAKVLDGDDPLAQKTELRQSATISELADVYKAESGAGRKERTKALYLSYWENWVKHPDFGIGLTKARLVTRADVAKLHRAIGQMHPTTANRVVTLLAHFYQWAGKIGHVPEGFNPAEGIERFKESTRERFLSTAELERLGTAIHEAETDGIPWEEKPGEVWSKHAPRTNNRRSKITPHAAAAIRLLLFTGARLREILHLKWSEVDLQRGLLLLPDSKTGRKTIVLGSAALQVIADLDKISEYVIAGQAPTGKPIGRKRVKSTDDDKGADKPRSDLNRPWALVCRRAGLKGVRLHDLRHTFASYGAAGGLGLPVIGGLLGHANSKTTQRYAHLSNDPLRRASEAISLEISAALSKSKAKANG
jgi:integrase